MPAYALRLVAAHFALYVPLGPFMILNMAGNRKRAFKKRNQAAHPRPLSGLVWPVTGTKNGAPERSTSKTNRSIWAAASGAAEQARAYLLLFCLLLLPPLSMTTNHRFRL